MTFFEKQGRYLLMSINVIEMVIGIIAVIIGIWGLAAGAPGVLVALLIVAGLISTALNYLGFRGAHKENTTMLKTYAWIVLVLTVLAITGAIINAVGGKNSESAEADNMIYKTNVMTYINIVVQIVCIVLAFGLASALTEKRDRQPPVYSNM